MSRLVLVIGLVLCAVAGTTPAAPVPSPNDEQERLLARGKKFAQQGKIDLFVAATAAWKLKADDDRLWNPARLLGRELLERTDRLPRRGHPNPAQMISDCPAAFPDLATYRKSCNRFTRVDELYLRSDPQQENPPILFRKEAIHAAGVFSPKGIHDGIIVSRGSVETGTGVLNSLLLVNGDVTAVTGLYSVVIVCDGNVTLTKDNISGAVIIARGNITAPGGAGQADLFAGGKVVLGKKPTVIRTEDGRVLKNTVIEENQSKPLGFITFFELSTVGLEVKAADKSVEVSAVAAGKPCDKAGLRAGDVVLEVNGKKPTDAESLRRLLRDALAIGDAALKLKRGDKTETLKVALPE